MSTDLTKHQLTAIDEVLYTGTLSNGLRLFLLPKKGFKEVSGLITVPYGALDTSFETDQQHDYPAGIAHFLEHKLFELKYQEDAACQFTALGYDSNAFTSYTQTSYIFSGIDQINRAIYLLRSMVSEVCVSDDSIAREKEIITQEINMYQDDADYRLYQGVLKQLYPNTPLAVDIAGTEESLRDITKDQLVEFHRLSYHPSQMTFFITGDIDPQQIFKELENNECDKQFDTPVKIKRKPLEHAWVLPTKSISMEVSESKLAVGLRGEALTSTASLIRQKLALRLFFSMLFGWTSSTYQLWYENGKIDDSFDIEIEVSERYQFVILSADTDEPIALSNRIRRVMRGIDDDDNISPEHFEVLKREIYGDFLMSLDSIDNIVTQFVSHLSDQETYFDLPEILAQLTLDDVVTVGRDFIAKMAVTDFTIFPK